jgi:hypothetical protein
MCSDFIIYTSFSSDELGPWTYEHKQLERKYSTEIMKSNAYTSYISM